MNWITALNFAWSIILLSLGVWLNRLARRVKQDAKNNLEIATSLRAVAEKNSLMAAANTASASQNAKMAGDLADIAARMRTHYVLMTRD